MSEQQQNMTVADFQKLILDNLGKGNTFIQLKDDVKAVENGFVGATLAPKSMKVYCVKGGKPQVFKIKITKLKYNSRKVDFDAN
jgi:hypothetical protein